MECSLRRTRDSHPHHPLQVSQNLFLLQFCVVNNSECRSPKRLTKNFLVLPKPTPCFFSPSAMTPPPLQHPSWVTDPAPYKVKEEPRSSEPEKRSESRNQSQHQSPQQQSQQQQQNQVQNIGEITMRSSTQSHTEPTPFHKHVKAVSLKTGS